MNPHPAVQMHAVTKTYAQGKTLVKALDNVSLTIPAGQFVAIMGASGSGKSTLLHLVAGLTTPDSGLITLFDQELNALTDNQLTRFRRRSVGLIFQAYNLLPTMTALENVALPLLIDGKSLGKVRPRAEDLLKLVGLEERMNHRPDELSGGQQQRVAIARALTHEAPLLLADEPTGNLDSKTGEEVLHLLRSLAEKGRTIIMVTHDPKAAAYAERVITLSDGQVIEEIGVSPERVAI
jgi:putative ABC transport system ATP-binding protein